MDKYACRDIICFLFSSLHRQGGIRNQDRVGLLFVRRVLSLFHMCFLLLLLYLEGEIARPPDKIRLILTSEMEGVRVKCVSE